MCGIFGIIGGTDAEPSTDLLRQSLCAIAHRGPDANGLHAAPGVGLASARLSLVDLDPRSNQPFWDTTRRYVLVFNGEIYNFRELGADLERRGVRLRTTSDTEVVLECLLRDPPLEALRRLDGMFALALYDTETGRLLVARDRFGMKPLYYHAADGVFAFGSTIRSLAPWLRLDADTNSLAAYLLGFGGPTKGFTFYRDVLSLPPGDYLAVERGRPPERATFAILPAFWSREERARLDGLAPRQAADRLEERLVAAVSRQLFADAPVGAFCSGGVDSSLIVAMAAKTHPHLAIFHANVVGPWSELHAAQRLAAHVKLDLHVVDVHDRDFVAKLPEAMQHYEHPYTHLPNSVPFMMVAGLARTQGVKGLLSGEGSDELFLGYPWFWRQPLVDAYQSVGAGLRRIVRALPGVGPLLWPHDEGRSATVQDVLNRGEVATDEQRSRAAAAALGPAWATSRDLASMDHLHYHLRTLLLRNDTMGMAAGVETRFPFLDHEVVRAAVNLPASYKLRFSPAVFEKAHPFVRDKWVVREVARRWIPPGLSDRIKIGFWTTVFQRLRVADGYFDDGAIGDLFNLSRDQVKDVLTRADLDLRLRLLHLDVWAEVCLRGRRVEDSAAKVLQHVTVLAA